MNNGALGGDSSPRSLALRLSRPASGCLAFVALALLCGCAARQPDHMVRVDLGKSPGSHRHSFSDEATRDLVKETQKLLALQGQDYLVGPDDVLTISIFEWELADETKTLDFRVSESGMISIPVLGAVNVAGKSLQQIQALIEKELDVRGVLQNPRVAVDITEYRSRRISVIGSVHAPGVYALHQNVSTLVDMLTLAGGPTDGAGRMAYVLRKPQGDLLSARMVVDLEDLLQAGDFNLNPVLQDGDVVYVPRARLIYVYGAVRQPGGYALRESVRVLEALTLAGGCEDLADRSDCRLVRRLPGGGEQVVPISIAHIERGKAPNLFLREGDVLHVPQSAMKTVGTELWDAVRGIFTFTYGLNPRR